MEKKSQTSQILEALKNGEQLSPIDALERFGCFRLGARIYELIHGKYDGHCYDIEKVDHEGKQFAVYRLRKELSEDERYDLFEPKLSTHKSGN